jgi:hypothetical protein
MISQKLWENKEKNSLISFTKKTHQNNGCLKRRYDRLRLLYLWVFISKLNNSLFFCNYGEIVFVEAKNVYFAQTKIYYATKIKK